MKPAGAGRLAHSSLGQQHREGRRAATPGAPLGARSQSGQRLRHTPASRLLKVASNQARRGTNDDVSRGGSGVSSKQSPESASRQVALDRATEFAGRRDAVSAGWPRPGRASAEDVIDRRWTSAIVVGRLEVGAPPEARRNRLVSSAGATWSTQRCVPAAAISARKSVSRFATLARRRRKWSVLGAHAHEVNPWSATAAVVRLKRALHRGSP